ncbi:MAG TPA: hypothetical protein VJS89_11405 [Gammaproteobacteria bacterium]|nr:hypothetical protein [Gammaproteobacteria bacterium]
MPATVLAFAAAALVVGGCSQKSAPTAAEQAAANEKAAAPDLALYQKLLAEQKPKLAMLIGQQIVSKYPGTSAAAEVQNALPALKVKAEHQRLADLWLYQTVDQGGLQYTATLDSSEPSGTENQVQLILRRHVGWPQAVYLYGHGQGFVCSNTCDIAMRVDGQREVWKGHLPETGEPAMFINNDQRFIAVLSKTKIIEMDVTTRDRGLETLKFEVGGYDPSKFPQLPKH